MKYELDKVTQDAISDILGYINFSSGSYEPRFLSGWNTMFAFLDAVHSTCLWKDTRVLLEESLDVLAQTKEAFRQNERIRRTLDLVYEHILPGYRKFHADLLFHQTDEFLFNSFFMAKVCSQTLSHESLWNDEEKTTQEVIRQLNDFIGYRPVPVLEDEVKHEPNPHEWVSPIPLYRKGVGAAYGPYREVVEKTLEILRDTDPSLLHDAWFDPDRLEELVLDPRAYDFDHPVNRRPNYSFGTWDPNAIDDMGYYYRFVVHQVTVDGIAQRTSQSIVSPNDMNLVPRKGLILEAGAVLAGTMLMGSGVTGDHVQTHDSTVSLSNLMTLIARYRDKFYDLLIKKIPDYARGRLEFEAKRLFQPFGGARQDLNKYLAKKRADQLQRFHLARTYARMGYFDAAKRQAAIISVTSARFLCQIDCHIAQAHLLADKKAIQEAANLIPAIEDLLYRGIACGALPDPWTILGFGAEYSLFFSPENSIHDHRIDDLINLMNEIFDLYSRLLKETAATGNTELQADLSDKMSDLAGWWDQYGSTEVSGVDSFSGQAAWESAAKVSTALATWHHAGPAAGDVAFWRRHVERFSSPKAFVLLGEALLEQKDLISSMALFMHWLSESERIPLIEGDYSFHSIVLRWMEQVWQDKKKEGETAPKKRNRKKEVAPLLSFEEAQAKWNLTTSFLDRLEANADVYWNVPSLDLSPEYFDRESTVKESPTDASDVFTLELGLSCYSLLPIVKKYLEYASKHRSEKSCKKYLQEKYPKLYELLIFLVEGDSGISFREFNRFLSAMIKWIEENIPNDIEVMDGTSVFIEKEEMKKFLDDWRKVQNQEKEKKKNDSKFEDAISDDNMPDSEYDPDADEEEDDDTRGIDPVYNAAYDNMTFHDSAEDGVDDNMMDGGQPAYNDGDDFELSRETERINSRLAFTFTMIKLWKYAVGKTISFPEELRKSEEVRQRIEEWHKQMSIYRQDLETLLDQTSRYHVPRPNGTAESLMEYDQHRGTKEILLDRIIWSIVEAGNTILFLEAIMYEPIATPENDDRPVWYHLARNIMSALFRHDETMFKLIWPTTTRELEKETLLYIPTSRGGDPRAIVKCRFLQQIILKLFEYMPRCGYLTQTFQLLRTVQKMERVRTNLPGAITEFDRLFETATKGVAECIVESSKGWRVKPGNGKIQNRDDALVAYTEDAVDILLSCWLSHSRHIRISAVESIMSPGPWESVKRFIIEYGEDLFSQQFLNFRNIRAILHQGVANYLGVLHQLYREERDLESGQHLIEDINQGKIDLQNAANLLELILECVAENYSEYVDYNSTTTQSDHGGKLYILIDMLRVLTAYERVSWNLKPVYWVHEVIVRSEQDKAATLWENSIARKSSTLAEENLRNYNRLNALYGIWLPSVHERLQERFVRPLQIDKMCGLVADAIADITKQESLDAFKQLEIIVEKFAESPMGVGFEVPEWLGDLQEEVISSQLGGKKNDDEEGEEDEQIDILDAGPVFNQVRLARGNITLQLAYCRANLYFGE